MTNLLVPEMPEPERFTDAAAAVARLEQIYAEATGFLCDHFANVMRHGAPEARIRAF